jgi:hypothetical protein
MYNCIDFSRLIGVVALAYAVGIDAAPAWAQASAPLPASEQHQHDAGASDQERGEHDMQMARDGSGTSWLPDTTPMYAIHWQRGVWQFMAHESAFL